MGAARGEAGQGFAQRGGVVRRQRGRARSDGKQRREGEVLAHHFGQSLGEPLRIGAAHHREVGDGDIDLLARSAVDVEPHVGRLRTRGRR